MIDDALLEDLFSSAAEVIEVPTEGAAQVLAARDALRSQGTRRHRTMQFVPRTWRRRPRLTVLAGVCALVVVAIAVSAIQNGGGSGPSASVANRQAHAPSSNGASIQGAAVPALGGTAAGSAGAASGAGGISTGAAGTGSSAPAGPSTATSPNIVPSSLPAKVIKTGSASLQVGAGQLPATMANLSSDAAGLGGFVASSTQTTGSSPSGDITLRVPVASFEVLVGDAQRLGKVTTLTTTGQDVTSQYVDLQARITSLQDARSQFEQILAKAQSIGDILSVESQIDNLQTQIEQLQGQLQVLDDQTTYSTLTVQVSEASKAAPAVAPKAPSGLSKAWAHARHSFTHGVEAIVAALGGVAVFVLFVAALAVLVRFGWTYLRRRLI